MSHMHEFRENKFHDVIRGVGGVNDYFSHNLGVSVSVWVRRGPGPVRSDGLKRTHSTVRYSDRRTQKCK